MLIRAHLYWLNGYPQIINGQLYWHCPLIPGEMSKIRLLTSTMMSKAHRVLNELQRDYHIALPKVVGDVNLWMVQCKRYLEFCKDLKISDKQMTVFSLFNKDKTYANKFLSKLSQPQKQNELVTALSWLHYIDRTRLSNSLDFVVHYWHQLQNNIHYDVFQLIQMSHLYALDIKQAPAIVRLLLTSYQLEMSSNSAIQFVVPFREFKFNKKNKNHFIYPKKPIEQSSTILKSWMPWLLSLNNNHRRNALSLLSSIDMDHRIKDWSHWWEDIEQTINKISNYIIFDNKHKTNQLYCLQYDLKLYLDKCPESIYINSINTALKKLYLNTALCKGLENFLNRLPVSIISLIPKDIWLIHFYNCIEDKADTNYVLIYLNELSNYLSKHSEPKYHLPWFPLSTSFWSTSEYDIFDPLKKAKLKPFFSVLGLINAQPNMSVAKNNMRTLALIIAAGFDEKRAIELASFLLEKDKLIHVSSIALRIIYEINETNENALILIKLWNKLDEEYTDEDTLKVIYETFLSINAKDLFHHLIFSDSIKTLLHCSYQIRIIKKTKGLNSIPKLLTLTEKYQDWIAQYPDIFRTPLALYNGVAPDAQAKTKKLFLSHWWPKSFITDEINLLSRLLSEKADNTIDKQTKSILSKIEHLESNLREHRPLSLHIQHKLTNLITKKTTQAHFKLWQQKLDQEFHEVWANFFNIELSTMPSWLLDDEMIRKLLPIIDFNTGSRELAKKVIKRRTTNQPWDFSDSPQNQAFLKTLSKQGVDITVWLDGIGKRIFQNKNNTTITIDVVNDPLDILDMGGHFKTCLSPGNFNYFSVFANIADINKRVLYGKNANGKVIGRVLIALLPSGGLNVFNIYYHNAKDEFEKYVLQYINEWVRSAGITLTIQGKIPTLVANEWYDDGSIGVKHGIPCFKDDSTFRKQLSEIKHGELKTVFEFHLKPLPINELTFPLFLQLPELKQSDSLYPELIQIAQSVPHLSIYEKFRLYELTVNGPYEQLCYKIFRKAFINHLIKTIKDDWFDDFRAKLIVQNNPIDTLSILRKMGRGKKNWKDNLYTESAEIAVMALRKLGRDKQADLLITQYHLNNKT